MLTKIFITLGFIAVLAAYFFIMSWLVNLAIKDDEVN